jgi:hypothetical protein
MFRPKGQELVRHYLIPKALGRNIVQGLVAEGVDVFTVPPHALPFSRHGRNHVEVWDYFFGAHPVGEWALAPAPGGCWFTYGREKAYHGGGLGEEAVAFRRRLQYLIPMLQQGGGDGMMMWPGWASTPWLMTEFRLNKGAAAFACALPGPGANMDCVVRKVFTKPGAPPLPPLPYFCAADDSTGSNHPGADDGAS